MEQFIKRVEIRTKEDMEKFIEELNWERAFAQITGMTIIVNVAKDRIPLKQGGVK